jgi:hypothetical protein
MAKQTVNIGTTANDGTGDDLRTAMDKLNDNFDEVYAGTPEYDVVRTDEIKSDTTTPTDVTVTTGAGKTLVLGTMVYDDLRVTPGAFEFAGSADPSLVSYTPGGSGTALRLYEFAVNDVAYFTVQLPHIYKTGEDIFAHVHWTPGSRGVEEAGTMVGWKILYSWANIGAQFPTVQTADCSDETFNGTGSDPAAGDDYHQMTPQATITGTGKGISSQLICAITRTDTGTDDTWVSTTTGELPLLLEIDFHIPIDTIGSRTSSTK